MSGKAAKQAKNEKEKKNQEIADIIMAYYLSEQEMPEYIAGIGHSMQDRYKGMITGLTTHLGLISANLDQIKKEVDKSKLSKSAKDKINRWLKVSVNEDQDERKA